MSCPICDDTGWKALDVDGVRRVTRCDCWKAGLGNQLLQSASIPKGYQHCDLSNFEQNSDSLRAAFRQAERFVDKFPLVDKGLLLYGNYGVGKTHLAVGILKDVIRKKNAQGYFCESKKFLTLIKEAYSSGSQMKEMDFLRPVLQAELLVFDDLGAERTTDWVQDTLGLIVNSRYSDRLPTIFTTNLLDPDDPSDPNSLMFRLGARVRSRLFEMCEWIRMDTADVREVGAHPTPERLAKFHKESPAAPGRLPQTGKPRQTKAQLKSRIPTDKDPRMDLKWTGGKAST